MKNHIVIDWLSFNCKSTVLDYFISNQIFKVEEQIYSTPHFKKVYLIYSAGNEICTICSMPHSKIFDSNFVQIKLHNKVLYTDDLITVIEQICNSFKLTFTGFSRIDLAYDFNPSQIKFDVSKFIYGNLTKRIIKKQRANVNLGFNTSINNDYHFIRYGQKQSDVCFYLYNKSKEMRDKKLKPWIIDKWLVSNIDNNTDVWRLEFSIKNTNYNLTDKTTGETITLKNINAISHSNISNLFSTLYCKYFDFRSNDGGSRVDRMKRVELIKGVISDFALTPYHESKESNRTQRLTIKKLLEEFHHLRTNKKIVKSELIESAFTYSRIYGLEVYAQSLNKQLNT
jgi:hypothetical protein